MNAIARLSFLAAMLSTSAVALAALASGTTAPDFATQAAQAGKVSDFSLKKALRRGPVVLYFYPAAFTPGCTVEANQFADAVPDFKKLGATVVGVSGDNIDTLKKFSVTECKSKFAVAVATPAIIAAYDVRLNQTARSNRTSFVITPDGKVIEAYTSMDYRGHVPAALAALKTWRAQRRK